MKITGGTTDPTRTPGTSSVTTGNITEIEESTTSVDNINNLTSIITDAPTTSTDTSSIATSTSVNVTEITTSSQANSTEMPVSTTSAENMTTSNSEATEAETPPTIANVTDLMTISDTTTNPPTTTISISETTTTIATCACSPACPSGYEQRCDPGNGICIGCFVPGTSPVCNIRNCIKYCSQPSECSSYCFNSYFAGGTLQCTTNGLCNCERTVTNAFFRDAGSCRNDSECKSGELNCRGKKKILQHRPHAVSM